MPSNVEIIVGLPKKLEFARRSVESLLKAKVKSRPHITVITPEDQDGELSAYLSSIEEQGVLTTARREEGKALAVALNDVLLEHDTKDVIFVAPGSIVSDGWVESMTSCRDRFPQIATLCASSNGAGIAGYPRPWVPNLGLAQFELDQLPILFSKANGEAVLELTEPHQGCVFLPRAAIRVAGQFSESVSQDWPTLLKDWSGRASQQGFKHFLCAGLFIRTIDQATGNPPEAAQVMQPKPIPAVHQLDPVRPVRRLVDWERLCRSPKPRVLLITHRQGGGVERHITDLASILEESAEALVMRPDAEGSVSIEWSRAGEDWRCWFDGVDNWRQLRDCLTRLNLRRVHLHHVDGLPAELWGLARSLDVPLDITLHDHWPLTSKYHLLPNAQAQVTSLELEWQTRTRALLQVAARVFSPSKYLADAVTAVHPEVPITIWPHATPVAANAVIAVGARVKVALLGRISEEKGLTVLMRCAEYAQRNGLALHFRIIGPPAQPIPTFPELPLDATGSYEDKNLAALIAIERPDVIFFPSQVPESFSYTLTAAMLSGLPIGASDLGAFSERLSDYPKATLLEHNAEAADWCRALSAFAPPKNGIGKQPRAANQDKHLAKYLGVFLAEPPVARNVLSFAASAPAPARYFPPKRVVVSDELSLVDLYRFGVTAGHGEAKRELIRRLMEVDQQWSALRSELRSSEERRRQVEASISEHLSRSEQDRGLVQELAAKREALDAELRELNRQLASAQVTQNTLGQELNAKVHQLDISNQRHTHLESALVEAEGDSKTLSTVNKELAATIFAMQEKLNESARLGSIVEQLNSHIKKLDAELHERQAKFAHVLQLTRDTLESERDTARAAFAAISTSKFWRVTSPLRTIAHAIKSLQVRTNNVVNQTKGLPRRVSIATQILREEGPVALGRRVQENFNRKEFEPSSVQHPYEQETSFGPLAVPNSLQPKVSIVIPVYGQHLLTFTCLKSIAATCAHDEIEVLVIDDCSPEPAATALSMVSGVKHIRNDENLGFLKNCNKAAALAKGEYVLLLNNDIIVTPGWLEALIGTFASRENVGMVGAKLIYPNGRLQEAGGIVWRDGSAWNWGRDQDASRPEFNYLREVDYCSGAVLLLRREFWNELGGFDERYAPAYYEDTDLAFRVRAAGKRVFYQPNAVVVHFEGQSSGTDVTQGIKRYQVVNQETFVSRWASKLAKHRVNGQLPRLERDRYAEKRILIVDACMLTPDQDSGSLRMFEMLGVLAKMNLKVTFFADNLEHREPYVSQIQALGVEVIYHPVESYVTPLLERIAAEYDVIMLSRATVAVKHIDTVKRVAPEATLIFDTVDLHFLRQEREAELADSALQRAAAASMREQELSIISKSDITIVVSPVERKLLAEISPRSRVEIVSNIHVTMPGSKPFSQRSGAIFIGGFRHPPNLDAIMWFVEKVLPILRQKNSGIVTTVIGSNAPASLQKYAAEDFVIAGFVEDVTPYYDDAKLSFSPLRYGAGVKGKVNIAMQYGVPVVATSPSVEGMHLRHELDVLRADTPEEFADAMIRIDTDQKLWCTLRANGLDNIETHFSRMTARKSLADIVGIACPE